MKNKNNILVKDEDRTLIYRPVHKRPSGVVGTLIGYIRDGTKFLYACVTIGFLTAFALPAIAQQPVTPKNYPVAPFQDTNLNTLKSYTNTTVTFPIWRGRGFAFHSGIFSTNLQAGSNITSYVFQFATPHTNAVAGTFITNWETASPLTFTAGMSSNQNFWGTNISSTLVDNYTLGRLYTVSNAATADTKVNLTNNYVSTIP